MLGREKMITNFKLPAFIAFSAVWFAAWGQAVGEVFLLRNGGQVEGELLNPQETPRRQYVINLGEGMRITLAAAEVEKVLRSKPEEAEYNRIYPTYSDTAEAQWALAEWCRERRLNVQRERHLRRVVELDPDHVAARHALGYSQVDGRWVTREEIMLERGYVRYKGQWRLPQEVQLLEEQQKLAAAQQEWFLKLKRWRAWLGGDRHAQAEENIRSINDPMAVKALAMGLRDEEDPHLRTLYIAALGNIDDVDAARALAIAAIADPEEELRQTCLDYLEGKKRPEVVAYFVGKLKDKDNVVVNRAALGLARMKDPSAIPALINALVTTHTFKLVRPGGDNAMSASFGSGGTGLSMGGGPRFVRRQISNQAVLDALVAITGCNFHFDKAAWKNWYAAQKKPPTSLDARRD